MLTKNFISILEQILMGNIFHEWLCRNIFKVDDHRFLAMTDREQFIPAPYMARARWVSLTDEHGIAQSELESLIQRSYQLYFEKLPQRTQREYLSRRF